jgi:parallel beta-helix repeat protein
LDVAGEYHVDKLTGVLHFLPPAPLTADSDLVVSVLDSVVVAQANHTKFEGLTISVARSVIFSTDNPALIRAGVQTYWANSVTVEDCVLSNSGAKCVNLHGSNNTARNNTVFGCGTSGISIISGTIKTLEHGNSSAVGNTIHDCSRIARTYTPGVVFHSVGCYFANNTISNQPHTSISGGKPDSTCNNACKTLYNI